MAATTTTTSIQRPMYACELCNDYFQECEGAMKLPCRHFFHEHCIARHLRMRADGMLRCLICTDHFNDSVLLHRTVLEELPEYLQNSVCWLCCFDLRRTPSTCRYGRARRGSHICQLMTCWHAYHQRCLDNYFLGHEDGASKCLKCGAEYDGSSLEYVTFTEENTTATGATTAQVSNVTAAE